MFDVLRSAVESQSKQVVQVVQVMTQEDGVSESLAEGRLIFSVESILKSDLFVFNEEVNAVAEFFNFIVRNSDEMTHDIILTSFRGKKARPL